MDSITPSQFKVDQKFRRRNQPRQQTLAQTRIYHIFITPSKFGFTTKTSVFFLRQSILFSPYRNRSGYCNDALQDQIFTRV